MNIYQYRDGITIETQLVGNGSYGIVRDFDPIGVFHVIADGQSCGTYPTLREAKKAARNAAQRIRK